MSNVVEFPAKDAIYDQASLWIAKLDRSLTPTEEIALADWLNANQEHRTILFEMAELWDKMDNLARLADLFQAPTTQDQKQVQKSPRRFYGAIAASLVAAALTFGMVINLPPASPLLAWLQGSEATIIDGVYETAIGEHSNVNLPDGSVLVLNTNSRVKVKYSEHHRLFFLERGEINIEVAHDTSRPLSVMAGDKVVQAVGTAFNVRIQNDKEVELIVTDGKVLVGKREPTQQNLEPIKTARLPANAMAISKGEKVVLGSSQEKIAKVEDVDIAAKLSWRQGNLVFRGETLEQALIEISRYTSVEFDVPDEGIRQERIAGLFKAGDVNGLLLTLDQNFNITHERLNNNKIRLSAR